MINPIRKIKQEKDLTTTELAKLAGVGFSTLQNIEQGRPISINNKLLALIEKLGYNKDQVKRDYEKCKEAEKEELLKKIM